MTPLYHTCPRTLGLFTFCEPCRYNNEYLALQLVGDVFIGSSPRRKARGRRLKLQHRLIFFLAIFPQCQDEEEIMLTQKLKDIFL